MDIPRKTCLYREARRVLASGSRLALWNIVVAPEQADPLPGAVGPSSRSSATSSRTWPRTGEKTGRGLMQAVLVARCSPS